MEDKVQITLMITVTQIIKRILPMYIITTQKFPELLQKYLLS